MAQGVPYRFQLATNTLPLSQLDADLDYASGKWVSVKDAAFGAMGDGHTNDAPAIQAALISAPGNGIIVVPPGVYLCEGDITIPQGVMLMGLSCGAANAAQSGILGAELYFTGAVSTCVTLHGGSARVAMRNLTINRSVAAPLNSIGVLVDTANDALLEDVYVYRSATGVKLSGCFGTRMLGVTTSECTDSHYWIAASSETHFLACRAGKNGSASINCNQYIRISGNTDSIWASECNFNIAGGTVAQCLLIDTITSQNGPHTFSQCHFEVPTGTSKFLSQTGSTNFSRLNLTACTVNFPGVMFDGTVGSGFLVSYTMDSCTFVLPAMTLTGAVDTNIAATTFISAVTVSAGSGNISGNFNSDVTLTGTYTGMAFNVVLTSGGTLTNTAAGRYQLRYTNSDATKNAAATQVITGTVSIPQGQVKFPASQNASSDGSTLDDYSETASTLGVTFATPGTSTFTPSTENNYTLTKIGREVIFRFNIVGTINIGTGAGALQLTGVPYTNANVASNYAIGTVVWGDAITLAGYTQMQAIMAPGTNAVQFAWSGAGVAVADVVAAHITTGTTLRLRGQITFHTT
jgi:hypothetical protein